jgi:hypothetical protein
MKSRRTDAGYSVFASYKKFVSSRQSDVGRSRIVSRRRSMNSINRANEPSVSASGKTTVAPAQSGQKNSSSEASKLIDDTGARRSPGASFKQRTTCSL